MSGLDTCGSRDRYLAICRKEEIARKGGWKDLILTDSRQHLLGSDFTEGNEQFVVNGSSIKEEDANDALNLFDTPIVEG